MSRLAQDAAATVVTATDAETMSLAPGVMETIIRIAVSEVDGVAGMCSPHARGSRKLFAPKQTIPCVDVTMEDNSTANVALHLAMNYGYALPDVAAQVREAVAEALATQVGVGVNNIDVYVDSIAFN